jgi:hypothetical protein
MARYKAKANDPAYSAEVGWAHGLGYWFAVYRGTDSDTLAEGGLECELPSLYDLIAASAPFIWWNQALFVSLRDAPWRDQMNKDPESSPSQIIANILAERYRAA